MLIAAVLSGYFLALAAPWLLRADRRLAVFLFVLQPLALTIYFWTLPVPADQAMTVTYAWVPTLGVNLSFYLDGLALLFVLLISGIGMLVMIYTSGYLEGHPRLGRFYAVLLMFKASMLGLVLAGNLLTLYVFWELTSISSYLLIGFDHERAEARSAAWQALLVTSAGGLALLAGLLLLGQAGGSLELSQLLQGEKSIAAHSLYLPCLLLVLAGAFTKSAQFPFHFWLPNAMEAPTPVSAYLHSATMVKAGVYLLARMSPILGGTEAWSLLVTTVGAATMVVGGCLAVCHTDLKRVLAYSTISALGAMVMLLGLGTTLAITACLVFLLAHALYKGALFMIAGAIEQETGTRDLDRLGGLRRVMPITAAIAGLGSLLLAGIGPVLSFIGKEMLLQAVWEAHEGRLLLVAATALAAALFVAVAGLVGIRPFFGPAQGSHPATGPRGGTALHETHEPPWRLWFGPALLAVLGITLGLMPGAVAHASIGPSVSAVLGRPEPVELALWHGWTPALALTAVSAVVGVAVYLSWAFLRRSGRVPPQEPFLLRGGGSTRAASHLERVLSWGPERFYDAALQGTTALALGQTRLLQNGYLRYYVLMVMVTTVGLVGHALLTRSEFRGSVRLDDLRFYDLALAGLIVAAALACTFSRSRLGSAIALGVVGYGLALVYVVFGAPDLAMTQFLIETLTVLLFVLVFYHLPGFTRRSPTAARVRDGVIALAAGSLMTALVLIATAARAPSSVSSFFLENGPTLAHGRNIVNAILVDFRGLDTLGEISVLAAAGIGIFALLKLRLEEDPNPIHNRKEPPECPR